MILFFKGVFRKHFVVELSRAPQPDDLDKFYWLFGKAINLDVQKLEGLFVGPRKEMITPWSTNAVEICQNMGIDGVVRIEEFTEEKPGCVFDPMLQSKYDGLDQTIFLVDKKPEPIKIIEDIATYNQSEGLALSDEEIAYLDSVSNRMGRKLTDSEVFGFSQVNSEHCRHKIFNGTFVIDGVEKQDTLFALIKKTSKANPARLVSAYKDNVAFVLGPKVEQFAPKSQDTADYFAVSDIDTVISLKAETHNFPTTVEPFNGAATGTGGEIRDRMAGGKGSMPIAGTAVYMTSYPRLQKERTWEFNMAAREWLYQTPEQILIKASNGASDFGNKFGQPLICGSVLTFEHEENDKLFGYDKVIMQAGGIGYGRYEDALKDKPEPGDVIVVLGGDNYRIGMGGGAVSSVATGEFNNAIELNAVQRSNPEMQKRVYNAIRAMAEAGKNPLVSIHDHGAGGHLNSLSELVEETGGYIALDKLPVGDPTLSAKEIIGNESQERMGLLIKKEDSEMLRRVAERERAPIYEVGKATGDMHFTFENTANGEKPIDWDLADMFGKPPRTVLNDTTVKAEFKSAQFKSELVEEYIEKVLQLESVACKDWLTNKVDRSVTGRIALQQTAGSVQLPLNNMGVVALDYQGERGIATSIGHAPVVGLANPAAGSRLAIAESLTNILWTPIHHDIKGVSLSANWMWPAKNPGENARLYEAVQGVSDFAIALGINIPTGKDSLSMTQKYKDGKVVYSPGTVIISATGEAEQVKNVVRPVLRKCDKSSIIYVDFSKDQFRLGGSALAQVVNSIGLDVPDVLDADYFSKCFNAIQSLIRQKMIVAGHDISAGGLITALLEMTFATPDMSMKLDLSAFDSVDLISLLFSEKPGVVLQVENSEAVQQYLQKAGITSYLVGEPVQSADFSLLHQGNELELSVAKMRDLWFRTSYLLDRNQCGEELAKARFENYKNQVLKFEFPAPFNGSFASLDIDPRRRTPSGVHAAIIREKGVNGDREMAYALHLAGFDVKDVHMTDLISGRETLEDVNFIVFVGGFSNSDVLGSAKGWAGAFLYNQKAKAALDKFYAREDTLSLGVCNGCQLMMELGLVYPDHAEHPVLHHNESHKFESGFVNVDIAENNSVMLRDLAGSRLGVWVAHGEGKFSFDKDESQYNIVSKYSYHGYPGNPNGSMFDAAAVCSDNGRHLAMMPHLERAFYPWHWAEYPQDRRNDDVTPWMMAFVNAKNWIADKNM